MIIGHGLRGTDEVEVPVVNGEYCQTALIGHAIMDADIFISLSHFKGHEATGFGAALKKMCIRDSQYPWQFSGGMRQRCVMAIALAADPDILFADEPTTALDVTIQAQILDLLREIQMKLGTATILVSHDLGVVARVADRVAVMYAGKIVEIGTAEEVYYDPRHPYTWGLMRSCLLYTSRCV